MGIKTYRDCRNIGDVPVLAEFDERKVVIIRRERTGTKSILGMVAFVTLFDADGDD